MEEKYGVYKKEEKSDFSLIKKNLLHLNHIYQRLTINNDYKPITQTTWLSIKPRILSLSNKFIISNTSDEHFSKAFFSEVFTTLSTQLNQIKLLNDQVILITLYTFFIESMIQKGLALKIKDYSPLKEAMKKELGGIAVMLRKYTYPIE